MRSLSSIGRLKLGLRRIGASSSSPPSSVVSAIHQQVALARAIVVKLPVQQTYSPPFAKYFWLVAAATFGEVLKLLDGLHLQGAKGNEENADYGNELADIAEDLRNGWDALGQAYRIRIYRAMSQGAATVDLGDTAYRANLLERLELLEHAADRLQFMQELGMSPTGESALYHFLDATNKFLRGVGENAVKIMEQAAKVPGKVARAGLSTLPWGWIALGFAAFIGGRWVLEATGPGGRYRGKALAA